MLYAKSDPIQSIKEHTDALLLGLNTIKKNYGEEILKDKQIDNEKFWSALKISCTYHDSGKVFNAFQNVILKKLHKPLLPTKFSYSIKHEQISPMLIPFDEFNLEKKYVRLITQAIYYHHERKNMIVDGYDYREKLKDIYSIDILPRTDKIEEELGFNIAKQLDFRFINYINERDRINSQSKSYIEYVLLKGLLHRLDHSASANIEVEIDNKDGKTISDYTRKYFKDKSYSFNDLQKFCYENINDNLVVVGSTGIGKTEAALIWAGNSKLFFTLPIRISINAIFDRINNDIKYKNVGLLHSSSLEYLEQKEEINEIQLSDRLYEESKNLSLKVTVCTINQIFPFVFKYKGYEKMYATLSYSKIVIDEIQAYSPNIAAVLLTGIKMIDQIGGRFMIMTATLPRIYKDYLDENNIKYKNGKYKKEYNGSEMQRHKVKIINKGIKDDIDKIVEKAKYSKVLIIVNTVNKAIEIYDELAKRNTKNLNLLHSRFMKKDRDVLENKIKDFSKSKESGVWISTQIVEASLDIDFDYLFTEMSTLDSLFQRMGRCYRNRVYDGKEANIYVYTLNASGIGKNAVYDKEIYKFSVDLLNDKLVKSNNDFLSEDAKVELVDKLYSKELLKHTDFLKDFYGALDFLDNIVDYENSKEKAQNILNDIETINVIPKEIYEENIKLFEEYEKCSLNKEMIEKKKSLKKSINKLIISIRPSQVKGCFFSINNKLNNLYYVDKKYDNTKGLILKNDPEYEYKSREF